MQNVNPYHVKYNFYDSIIEHNQKFQNPENFFVENQQQMKQCRNAVGCLDLNKASQIKHVFEKLLNTQKNVDLHYNLGEIFLTKKNINLQTAFSLKCSNSYNEVLKDTSFSCSGLLEYNDDYLRRSDYYTNNNHVTYWDDRLVYTLNQINNETWEETLPKSKLKHVFSSQEKPKLFEKIFNDCAEQLVDLSSCQPTSCATNMTLEQLVDLSSCQPTSCATNMALTAIGTLGIVLGVYKIHSILSKRWALQATAREPLETQKNNSEPKTIEKTEVKE